MEPFYTFSGAKENIVGRSLQKSSTFDNPVIIVNGFNGSGKTLLAPIISALPKTELMTFAYPIEWTSSILYAGDMSSNAYKEFVKMFVDESIYNQQMSRSVNFRFSDLSSVFKTSKKFMYFSRLFKKGDDHVVQKIKDNNPISSFTTNHLLPFFPILSEALKDRLLFIETVKDPLTMFEQAYILRQNVINVQSEKDFTFRAISASNDLSIFDIYSSEDIFKDQLSLSLEENLVNWLERIVNFTISFKDEISDPNLIFVPFEDFVLDPLPFIKKISQKVGVSIDKKTIKEMKKQKVPREILSAGLLLPIYKRYGAKAQKFRTLDEEKNEILNSVKNLIKDDKIFNKLVKISETYNQWRKSLVKEIYS